MFNLEEYIETRLDSVTELRKHVPTCKGSYHDGQWGELMALKGRLSCSKERKEIKEEIKIGSDIFYCIMQLHEYFARQRVRLGCPFHGNELEEKLWKLISPYKDIWQKWRKT